VIVTQHTHASYTILYQFVQCQHTNLMSSGVATIRYRDQPKIEAHILLIVSHIRVITETCRLLNKKLHDLASQISTARVVAK
jgi:hypothetical protein